LINNPYYKDYQINESFRNALNPGNTLYDPYTEGQQARASYGNIMGLSRRLDKGILERQNLGDSFTEQKKYLEELMKS